jgi:hypothetical protein
MSKSIPISQLQRRHVDTHAEQPANVETINEVLQSLENDYEEPGQQSPQDDNVFEMDGLEDYDEEFQASQQMQPDDMIQTWLLSSDDLKDALIVFAIFIIATKIPIEKLIYKYISLEHIPLSDIFIKAAIAGLIFFFIRKFLI